MKQGQFEQTKKINPQRLNEEIKSVLGDKLVSMDTGIPVKTGFIEKTCIILAVTDDITEADNAAVQAVIDAHDPESKSAGQRHNENVKQATERLKTVDLKAKRDKVSIADQITELYALLADIQLWIQGERTD